jgi:hypothetical protein
VEIPAAQAQKQGHPGMDLSCIRSLCEDVRSLLPASQMWIRLGGGAKKVGAKPLDPVPQVLDAT